MKRILSYLPVFIIILLANNNLSAQSIKVGVFDIDVMVQATPAYREVDSLVQVYERDSLGAELDIYQSEYKRLDSTYKIDSVLVSEGKMSKKVLDYTSDERQKMALNILYWRQIAQGKSNNKRSQLAQPIYLKVADAYKKVLGKNKYSIILKPQTYEYGFHIDNIFISVAKELKLPGLPQELLVLGDDPDAATTKPAPSAIKLKSKAN